MSMHYLQDKASTHQGIKAVRPCLTVAGFIPKPFDSSASGTKRLSSHIVEINAPANQRSVRNIFDTTRTWSKG